MVVSWWFVVVCGVLWWFVVFSATRLDCIQNPYLCKVYGNNKQIIIKHTCNTVKIHMFCHCSGLQKYLHRILYISLSFYNSVQRQ